MADLPGSEIEWSATSSDGSMLSFMFNPIGFPNRAELLLNVVNVGRISFELRGIDTIVFDFSETNGREEVILSLQKTGLETIEHKLVLRKEPGEHGFVYNAHLSVRQFPEDSIAVKEDYKLHTVPTALYEEFKTFVTSRIEVNNNAEGPVNPSSHTATNGAAATAVATNNMAAIIAAYPNEPIMNMGGGKRRRRSYRKRRSVRRRSTRKN